VLRTIENEKTDALILGSGVDCYLTRGKKTFQRLFKPVQRRTNADGLKYTECTQSMYAEIIAMSERVANTSAFKELEKFERQVVLTIESPIKVCGQLDFLSVKGSRADIVDLKTSRVIDPDRYFYHCLDYNYFIQAACYKKLVLATHPAVTEVNFFHLVIGKEDKNYYKVQTFKFADAIIDEHMKKLDKLIVEISQRTDWSPEDTSFEKAVVLGDKFAEPAITTDWLEETV
jgi:hypothetical protein